MAWRSRGGRDDPHPVSRLRQPVSTLCEELSRSKHGAIAHPTAPSGASTSGRALPESKPEPRERQRTRVARWPYPTPNYTIRKKRFFVFYISALSPSSGTKASIPSSSLTLWAITVAEFDSP